MHYHPLLANPCNPMRAMRVASDLLSRFSFGKSQSALRCIREPASVPSRPTRGACAVIFGPVAPEGLRGCTGASPPRWRELVAFMLQSGGLRRTPLSGPRRQHWIGGWSDRRLQQRLQCGGLNATVPLHDAARMIPTNPLVHSPHSEGRAARLLHPRR